MQPKLALEPGPRIDVLRNAVDLVDVEVDAPAPRPLGVANGLCQEPAAHATSLVGLWMSGDSRGLHMRLDAKPATLATGTMPVAHSDGLGKFKNLSALQFSKTAAAYSPAHRIHAKGEQMEKYVVLHERHFQRALLNGTEVAHSRVAGDQKANDGPHLACSRLNGGRPGRHARIPMHGVRIVVILVLDGEQLGVELPQTSFVLPKEWPGRVGKRGVSSALPVNRPPRACAKREPGALQFRIRIPRPM